MMEVEASQFVPRPMDSPRGASVSHGADVDHPFASFGGDAQMGAHDMAVRGDNEDGASDHALLDPDMVLDTRSHSARGTDAAGIQPEPGALDSQRIHGADGCPSQEDLGAASPSMSRGAAGQVPAHCVWKGDVHTQLRDVLLHALASARPDLTDELGSSGISFDAPKRAILIKKAQFILYLCRFGAQPSQEHLVSLRLIELLSAVTSVGSLAELHAPCTALLLSGEWSKRAAAVGLKPDGVDVHVPSAPPPIMLSPTMRSKQRSPNTNGAAHRTVGGSPYGREPAQPLTENGLDVGDGGYALDMSLI
eukprot:jgi/Ulvmu1/451/UM001_0458.1